MSSKKDWSGGLFDFNNDGNLDFGEEFLAYKMCEDSTKNNYNNNYRRYNAANQSELIIPESPTEAEYKEIIRQLKSEKRTIKVAAIIMVIGVIGIFACTFTVAEHPFFSLLIVGIALFTAYAICNYISRELNKNSEKREQLEKNYTISQHNKS